MAVVCVESLVLCLPIITVIGLYESEYGKLKRIMELMLLVA